MPLFVSIDLRTLRDVFGHLLLSAFVLLAGKSDLPASQLDIDLNLEFSSAIQPMLQKYCYECHSGKDAESSVDLETFQSLTNVRDKQSLWEQIRGIVRLGAMPPKDYVEQPSDVDRERISNWIYQSLNAVDCDVPSPIPLVTVRRLNKFEYDNTVRDLFGLSIKPAKEIAFVSDDVGNGFDNQGEVLTLSPLILEKYLQAAEWVSQQVISLDPNVMRSQSADLEPIFVNESETSTFNCTEGQYTLQAKMYLSNSFGEEIPGKGRVEVYFDKELVETVETSNTNTDFKWTRNVTEGAHEVTIRLVEQPENIDEIARENKGYRGLRIQSLKFEGPQEGEPPMPIPHQRVIVSKPSDSISLDEAAGSVVKNILPKAFRRPCSKEEIDKISSIIIQANKSGWSFEEAVQFGLQAILVSPDFLFRIESSGAIKSVTPEESPTFVRRRLDSFEIANRLSYFLWSSMPDEETFKLASKGGFLNDDSILQEIGRLIGDQKSDAMITGFFEQWLGLRNLKSVDVDEKAFPIWSDPLRDAMEKETFLFCQSVLREGSILDLVSANYTYVNPRLAEYYGIPFEGKDPAELYPSSSGRSGKNFASRRLGRYREEGKWVRVELPEQRRGLLTHASILTLTSNPTRTSPVKRGKWVLENIIGDPPPPAPPGVPALEKSGHSEQNLTLRQMLELHRADPGCASCHNVLDPIGLGLENFNTVGQWRIDEDGIAIDAKGKLQDGRAFEGPRELLKHLEADGEKIARHFVSKLLTYALGRGLVRQDQCAIDRVLDQTRINGYRIVDVIRAVACSEPFLYRTVLDDLNAE